MNFGNKKEKTNPTGILEEDSMEKFSSWKNEEIFHEGDSYFSKMLEDISRATVSVYLETYIFELDDFGKKILDALKKVAENGVKIYILVDGVGSSSWTESVLHELYDHKIEARVYHPLPWISFHLKLKSRSGFLRRFILYLSRLNRRNHRKVCIIDEKISFVGSFNISVVHLSAYQGKNAWRDTGVRVEGREILNLISAFQKTWIKSWGIRLEQQVKTKSVLSHRKMTPLLRLNDSFFLRHRFNEALFSELENAKQYIRIINSYFIPTRRLIRALIKSAQRGIEVIILIPYKSDVRITKWITLVFAKRLLLHGIKVFEYLPTILHAKIVMTDQKTIVGSTNLNHRSFIHDLEVEIILLKPSSRFQLEAQFFKDLSHSQELKPSHFQGIRFWQKLLGRFFFLWRYWM